MWGSVMVGQSETNPRLRRKEKDTSEAEGGVSDESSSHPLGVAKSSVHLPTSQLCG